MPLSGAPPRLNGNGVIPAETVSEGVFLEKLLQIRDDVLAGKHPRIHLPPKIIEQVAPRPSQTAPPARPTANGTLNGTSAAKPMPPLSGSAPHRPSPSKPELALPVARGSRPPPARFTSSGIDPVLLTKSDHLIRAELQLKRQQLERILKDQVDKRARSSEEEPEFLDVESLLSRAQALVRPVSGLQIPASHSDGADSFDENSYYSSKAESWSSEEGNRSQNVVADTAVPLVSPRGPSAREAPPTAPSHTQSQAEPLVIEVDDEPYEPADELDIYEPEPEPAGFSEEADESDYSPPPADSAPSVVRSRRGRAREAKGGAHGSRRHSSAGPPSQTQNSRKRKREERKGEKRRQQTQRRVARSPSPYIKEEPQSPPPFALLPDAHSSKRRVLDRRPSGFELLSTQADHPIQSDHFTEQDPSVRSSRHAEPLTPVVAQPPQRWLDREDTDLRRVASLQQVHRGYSPPGGDLYAMPEPRRQRAASHAFAERLFESPLRRDASVRPSAVPRYVRERSRSLAHEQLSRPQSPLGMPPPPRRIVVDQYGNRFYAEPIHAAESTAPPSRRVEPDPYFERAATREPTMRAPLRAVTYEEEAVQRMPPPPPRRLLEASEPDFIEAQPHRREALHRPLDMTYREQELYERRPMPPLEHLPPSRDHASGPVRAYSVRPDAPRRDVAEGYVRHESIQPSHFRVPPARYREVSVVHPDSYEDRVAVPQPRRYLEDRVLQRPLELAQDSYAAEPQQVRYRYQ